MRPSEQRRLERQSWVHFVLLCFGAVCVVVLADWVANILVEDRWQPQPEAPEQTPVAEPVFPEHPLRAHAGALIQAAEKVRATLRAERSVTLDGSVLFMKGGFDVAHVVVGTGASARLALVTVSTPETASAGEPGDGQRRGTSLSLGVYERSGGAWKPIKNELFVHAYPAESAVTPSRENIALEAVGDGVWAWRYPVDGRCLPAVASDRTAGRTVYFTATPGDTPRVLLDHVSDGVRGNAPSRSAAVRLRFEETEGQRGSAERGVLSWTLAEGEQRRIHEVAFRRMDSGWALGLSPASLLSDEEQEASAAAREGREDAEERYRDLLEAFELVARLEGDLPYCLEMPHRARLAASVDRERWTETVDERVFRMRLQLAVVLASRGRGRAALQEVGLPDPSLVLSSLPQGRKLLTQIAGPTITPLVSHAHIDLRARPTFRTIHEVGGQLPMLWSGSGDLLVPVVPEVPSKSARYAPSFVTTSAAGVLGYLRGLADPFAGRLAPHLIWHGAARGAAFLLAAEDPRGLVPELVEATHARALRLVGSLAERDHRYTGDLFQRLTLPDGTLAKASWDEMQAYAPYTKPIDLSPSSSRLLADYGLTCDHGFIELCIGFPEDCRELERRSGDPLVPSAARPTTLAKVVWPMVEAPGCYPGEVHTSLDIPMRLMGWLGDDRLVFEYEGAFVQASVAITGEVETDPMSWKNLADANPSGVLTWPVGRDGRFTVALDDYGIWILDQESGREMLVQWWNRLSIGPPEGDWQATLSPNGRYLAIWLEGEGIWVGRMVRLPK